MTVCSGLHGFSPLFSLILFIISALILIFFLIYRPFRNKQTKSKKILSVISCIIIVSLSFIFFALLADTCYYAFKPNFVKDYSFEITSKQQAEQVFSDFFSEEFKHMKAENKTYFDFIVNRSLNNLRESQDSYFVGYLHTEYKLTKDGKLYKRSIGA